MLAILIRKYSNIKSLSWIANEPEKILRWIEKIEKKNLFQSFNLLEKQT